MAAQKLDMMIPFGDGGYIHYVIDITDITTLDDAGRAFLADTCSEVCAVAGRVLASTGHAITATAELGELTEAAAQMPPATVYDPNLDVLNGVTGTRRNTS